MIFAIAMFSGMLDIVSLMLLFTVNALMNLFELMMELHNQTTEKTNWTAFIYGCIAGAVTCLAVFIYLFTSLGKANVEFPSFVYAVLITFLVFFNSFAINMFLQYKKIGPWKNYLFGETVYVLLSLVAKSVLAWQPFRWDSSAGLITLNKERHHTFKQTLSFSERGVGTLLFA
jgi:apolipoprotein N-acyltransferase